MASSLSKKIFIIIILALLFRIYFSIVTPLWQFPDEIAHFKFAEYFAKNNNIPVMIRAYVEYFQPPVYYVIQGIILKPFLSSALSVQVHVLRLVSIIFGILTIFIVYKISKLLFPDNENLILIATSFAAFLPSFASINANITNANMADFISAVVIYAVLKIVISKHSYKHYFFVGLLAGVALLTRINLIPLIAATAIVFFFNAKEGAKFNIKKFIKICLIVYGTAFLISSWWYFRNFKLYGDFIGYNAMQMSAPHDVIVINALYFARLFGWAFITFWAAFGITNGIFLTLNNLFSAKGLAIFFAVYGILFLITISAFIGFVVFIRNCIKKKIKLSQFQKISLIFLGVHFILTLITFQSYNTYDFQPQGRYFYPALPFFSLIYSIGAITLLKEKRALWFTWVLFLLLGIGSVVRTIADFII